MDIQLKALKALKALENIRVTFRDDFNFPFNITPEYKSIKEALEYMKINKRKEDK